MQYDNVIIAEGALPQAVQQRAVDNERSRSRALPIREHPASPAPTQRPYGVGTNELPGVYTNTPQLSPNLYETLPGVGPQAPQNLMEALPGMATPVPDITEPIPTVPRKLGPTSAAPGSVPSTPASSNGNPANPLTTAPTNPLAPANPAVPGELPWLNSAR